MAWKEDIIKWLDPTIYKRFAAIEKELLRLEPIEKDLATMKAIHSTSPHIRRQ